MRQLRYVYPALEFLEGLLFRFIVFGWNTRHAHNRCFQHIGLDLVERLKSVFHICANKHQRVTRGKRKKKGFHNFCCFLVCPLGGNNLARVRRLIYKESVEIINGVGAGPSPTHMNFSKHRAGPSETSAQGVLWTIIIIIIIIVG